MSNHTHYPISITTHHHPIKKKRTKLFLVDNTTSTPVRKKKPDPNAPKITRPCTECGKRFWSWKALFGHMRCHPERQWRGINPPLAKLPPQGAAAVVEEEELEVAACLLMLANGPSRPCMGMENKRLNLSNANVSSAELGYEMITNSRYNISSTKPDYVSITTSGNNISSTNVEDNSRFECLSCKKVFASSQALGGHRATHKNVKGCFAIRRTGGDDVLEGGGRREMVASGHKCGMCLRIFSSGQALGGHMRCHFEKGGLNCLDLNLPAPIEDINNFSRSFSCFPTGLALDLRLGI